MGAKTRKLSQINDSLIEWQSVVVADGSTGLTAVAGRGYFINTTGGTITVTLPTSPKTGDIVQLKDYARTWATNAVTIASTTLDGSTNNPSFSTDGQTITLVYMDNTKGWSLINEDTTTGLGATFITATGGTVLTSGNFKTHVFTGDGSFVVATVGNSSGSNSVEYLVVAGGGSGGNRYSGGGGAGGLRQNYPSPGSGGLSVTTTTYPITVGAGGAGVPCSAPTYPGNEPGNRGSNSIFSTITSTGGGGGQGQTPGTSPNLPGGSGGGGSYFPGVSGTGNTPPVSPPQGNPGGTGNPAGAIEPYSVGGGGGAGAAASAAPGPASGTGGVGLSMSPTFFGPTAPSYGTPGPAPGRYFAGGGGGGATSQGATAAPGGAGGGGAGGTNPPATPSTAGTVNTGGGSGGAYGSTGGGSGNGGSGIVVIRYQFQ